MGPIALNDAIALHAKYRNGFALRLRSAELRQAALEQGCIQKWIPNAKFKDNVVDLMVDLEFVGDNLGGSQMSAVLALQRIAKNAKWR